MTETRIEVAWPKAKAERLAAEHRAGGGEATVRPYDDETFCVHITDAFGTPSGLLAKYAGAVQ